MADPKAVLAKLHQNLNILRERESKYGGNAPLELLNQIEDHQKAIALTEQALRGELSQVEWQEAMKPLLVAIDARSGEAASSVTIGDIQGGIVGSEIAGRDISIGQKIVNIFTGDTSQRDQRNRQVMLKAVKEFWVKGVLENSLHNTVLLQLGIVEKKEAVAYPWGMVLQAPHQLNRTLTPGTKMIDIFDQHQSLVILGEPGAGKTTMLLELARDLITLAERDPAQLIPVVFNLSSWTNPKQTLADWLVAELNSKYSIPKKIARPWVENDELLLLLDGLDEVASERREDCVRAINDFHQEHLMPLVVCSRIDDYEILSTRLKLQNAVVLRPLTPQQVNSYLDKVGPDVASVQMMLQEDQPMQELAKSPLMLSIMALAYRGKSAQELQLFETIEARRRHLFDTYVQKMFKRRGVDRAYSSVQINHWLAWLAQKMSQHAQTVFLIEQLQPTWLDTGRQWFFYKNLLLLIGMLLYGLIGKLLYGLLFILIRGLHYGLISGLIGGAIVGMIGGITARLIDELNEHHIETFEMLSWSQKKALVGLLIGTLGGLLYGLFTPESEDKVLDRLLAGLVIAVITAPIGGLIGGLVNRQIEMTIVPNQGIRQSAQTAIVVGMLYVLLFVLTGGLLGGLILGLDEGLGLIEGMVDEHLGPIEWLVGGLFSGLLFGLTLGPLFGLFYGGLAVIQHLALRCVLTFKGNIPPNYTRFLDYCADRILLRKVGGGYIFIHRYLMEYFASLGLEQVE